VREYPVDLLISIHHNATETHDVKGSEILVQIAYEHDGAGQELARCIETEYRALGRTIRPTKYQHSAKKPAFDRLYLLRTAYERGLLAVMSEYCFLDVDSELQLVLTDEGLTNEAEALTNDTHIANLRKKLGLQKEIRTVYKAGYRLDFQPKNTVKMPSL